MGRADNILFRREIPVPKAEARPCKNSLDQATHFHQFNYEKAGSVVTVSRLTEVLCPSLYVPCGALHPL